MPFVTEKLFIAFYVPLFDCPSCGRDDWGNTTHIRGDDSEKVWSARTICRHCDKVAAWQVDPDAPMETQSKRSRLHDGRESLIE